MRCEEPNDKVNDITAQLQLEGSTPTLLTEDNFLLRGCQLRNTEWVLALVVACGVQTKINYLPGAERLGQPVPLGQRLRESVQAFWGGHGPKPKVRRRARHFSAVSAAGARCAPPCARRVPQRPTRRHCTAQDTGACVHTSA